MGEALKDAVERWLGVGERRSAAYRAILGAGRVAGAGDAARDLGVPFRCAYIVVEVEAPPADHLCGPDCPRWRLK